MNVKIDMHCDVLMHIGIRPDELDNGLTITSPKNTICIKYYNGKIRHIYLTSYISPVGRKNKG
jgi:hypothetical protein